MKLGVVRLSEGTITPNLLSSFSIFENKCTWCTSLPSETIEQSGYWSDLRFFHVSF